LRGDLADALRKLGHVFNDRGVKLMRIVSAGMPLGSLRWVNASTTEMNDLGNVVDSSLGRCGPACCGLGIERAEC